MLVKSIMLAHAQLQWVLHFDFLGRAETHRDDHKPQQARAVEVVQHQLVKTACSRFRIDDTRHERKPVELQDPTAGQCIQVLALANAAHNCYCNNLNRI